MMIEQNVTPYIVFADDPILVGLGKINANQERVVFCVDERGVLRGALSDGDFRRWIVANPSAPLDVSCIDVANPHPRTAAGTATPTEISAEFGADGVSHVPLVDERGHLLAVAVNRPATMRI